MSNDRATAGRYAAPQKEKLTLKMKKGKSVDVLICYRPS